MSNTELPPLPDPIHMGLEEVDWNEFVPVTGYTADQMREYARAALAQPAASGEPPQIRADFEQRMIGVGASPAALRRLKSGEYLSPSIQSAWEAEKQKYATAQPAPAPLTDEQINQITAEQWGAGLGAPYAAYRAYARAIEAAHGIAPDAQKGADHV